MNERMCFMLDDMTKNRNSLKKKKKKDMTKSHQKKIIKCIKVTLALGCTW